MSTTEGLLNSPPGLNIPPVYNDNGTYVNGAFGSMHPNGANFLFGDGRVDYYVSDTINKAAYDAMATIDLGETVDAE